MEQKKDKKAEEVEKDKIVKEVLKLKGNRPNLALVFLGEPSSKIKKYIQEKELEAKRVGIDLSLYKLSDPSDIKEVGVVIDYLNNDENIDAIFIEMADNIKLKKSKLLALVDKNKNSALEFDLTKNDEQNMVACFKETLSFFKKKHNLN